MKTTIADSIKDFKNINIIDIRDEQRYLSGHLPYAINIEKSNLLATPEQYLDKSQHYYITCGSGNSAKMIATILHEANYDITLISDGTNGYSGELEK